MPLTIRDMKPVGLCITTEELFDTKRFLGNFCDGLLMADIDSGLKNRINYVKREMNAFRTRNNFLHGYKTILADNIDKILRIVASRYKKSNFKEVNQIITDGRDLVRKILNAQEFENIADLEVDFKNKISLPVYHLFLENLRKERGVI